MYYRILFTTACFVLCVGSVSAQSKAFTGSVTTTESTEPDLTQEEQKELWQERKLRAKDFRAQVLATRRGLELFAEYQEAYLRNRKEHAADCRDSRRRANKNGRFAVAARCYRTDLLIGREFWQKNLQQVENLPGISAAVRLRAITVLTNMIDAIDAIILGIDSDVYSTEEGLIEAKKLLHTGYRAPVSLALSHIRADRTLTWIAHFMTRMLYLIETEEIQEETFTSLQQNLYCLEIGELFMQEILVEEDYKKANLLLSQSLQHLQTCSVHLRKGYELHNL